MEIVMSKIHTRAEPLAYRMDANHQQQQYAQIRSKFESIFQCPK